MSFGDCFIDASLYALDEELEKVDEFLSDAQLLRPFEEVFDPINSMGRPGTAVGIYLRMMYLKFRWGLSYEEVEREVRERLPWRYFCHLSLMDVVPDSTTLIKLNQRFGEERVVKLNRELVGSLVKSRTIKARRIRIDSRIAVGRRRGFKDRYLEANRLRVELDQINVRVRAAAQSRIGAARDIHGRSTRALGDNAGAKIFCPVMVRGGGSIG